MADEKGIAAEEAPSEITIKLRSPLKFGTLPEVSELNLREPTAGELEKVASTGNGVTVTLNLIKLLTNHPRKLLEGMSQRDLQECDSFFASFQRPNLPTAGE